MKLTMRKLVLSSTVALSVLGATGAHAVPFQEGRTNNCTAKNTCSVKFAGPGPGKRLTVQNITCKVLTSQAAPAWVVELFDGNNALYLKTEIQDNARRSFVASTTGPFITGGSNIETTVLLGGFMNSQISCTMTGQST